MAVIAVIARDDEPRRKLKLAIEELGHRAAMARDLAAGLELLRSERPKALVVAQAPDDTLAESALAELEREAPLLPLVVALSERKAVVAHIDYKRRLTEPGLVQIVKNSPEIFVQPVHGLAILFVQVIERRHRVIVVLPCFHMVDTVDTVTSLANPMGLRLIVAFGVGHSFRAFYIGLCVAALVAFRRLEWIMYGLERQIQKERPIGISAVLKPL